MSETERRQERRKDRFSNMAFPTVSARKLELSESAKKMREAERWHRNKGYYDHADSYREAGNALENAIAELENFQEQTKQ